MRILLTGGAGYIGSACLRWLLRHGHDPIAYDNMAEGNAAAVPGAAERLVVGDILDLDLLARTMRERGVEAVMHFAALASVPDSIADPDNYYRANVVGTKNVLDAMRAAGVDRIVFSSTAATYAFTDRMPLDEGSPQVPQTPYGTSKLSAEWLIQDYARAYGLGYAILRYFNASGADPDGEFGESRHVEGHLIPLTLQVAVGKRERLKIFGGDWPTRDGTCVRDYVHTEDLAQAHQRAIENIGPGVGRVYCMGSGAGTTILEVLRACEEAVGRPIPHEVVGRRSGDPAVLIASPARIARELGWTPRYPDIRDIVATAWEWHRTHPDGYARGVRRPPNRTATRSLPMTLPASQPRALGSFAPRLAAVTALGAILRFFRLDAQCLWFDEVWAYGLAREVAAKGLLEVARQDSTAPLSFWMLAAFDGLGMDPVLALRLPSALFGTAAVALTGLLGRKLFRSEPVGLAAAVLVAISPFAIWYAQDGRMYAMLMALGAAYVLIFWDMLDGPARPWHWAAMAAISAVSLYTHQLGPLVAVACGLYLLPRVGPLDRRTWLYAITQAVVILGFVPWVLLSREKMASKPAGFPKGDMAMWVPYTLFTEVFGFSFGPSVRELRGGAMAALKADLPWILLPSLGAAWVGLVGLRRALRGDYAEAGRFCLIWVVAPIAMVVASTSTGLVSYNVRYLAGIFPAVALLLACGLLEARRSAATRVAAAFLLGGLLISLYHWYATDRYAKEEIRGAAARLARDYRPGDLTVISSMTAALPLEFYGFTPPEDARIVLPNPGGGTSETLQEAMEALERAGAESPGRRVWLVEYRVWESDPGGTLRRWLDEHARPIDAQAWPGAALRAYRIAGGTAARGSRRAPPADDRGASPRRPGTRGPRDLIMTEPGEIAYLFNSYPYTAQAAMRREIVALEGLGVPVDRYTIRASIQDLVDEADRSEKARSRAVLDVGPLGLLAALVATAIRAPAASWRALKLAVRMGRVSERGLPAHLAYLAEACVLRRWLADRGTRHLHAHYGTNSAAVAMLCRVLGGPAYSFTMHGPEEFDAPRALSLKEKIRHARFVVAICEYTRSQLYRWADFADWPKIHVVHCGVSEQFLDVGPTPVPETPRLVNVGRIAEQKGQILLIEAAGRLADEGLDLEVVIVGDGPLRGEAERLIDRLGLRGKVRITGFLSNQDVLRTMQESRALVLPSFAEGLPGVFFEALALGRPVIATYIAGNPELIEPGACGWLVPAGSVEALVDAMRAALTAPAAELERMGREGARRVAERHDARTEAARLAALFDGAATPPLTADDPAIPRVPRGVLQS